MPRPPTRDEARDAPAGEERWGPISGDADDLQVLREALGDLREEIRDRFGTLVKSEASPPASLLPGLRLPEVDWESLFTELRKRLATLGMREHSGEVDGFGFDVDALESLRGLLDFLYETYWRVEVEGGGALPAEGPALLVANRGGLLPYDAFMLAHAVERELGRDERPRIALGDDWMTLPWAQSRLARLGAVRSCHENVLRLLESEAFVAVFPEGARGATKEFADRYQVQRFGRGGVVRLAVERGVPVIPVGIVGAEEAQPLLHKSRAPGRALGLPFVPLTPTFPWLGAVGALPLPTRWSIHFGEALALDDLPPDAARDELLISRLTEELRSRVQSLVDAGLEERRSVFGFDDAE